MWNGIFQMFGESFLPPPSAYLHGALSQKLEISNLLSFLI
jgi:hypothetical protein